MVPHTISICSVFRALKPCTIITQYGPLHSLKGSDARALGFYRVYKGSPFKGPYYGTHLNYIPLGVVFCILVYIKPKRLLKNKKHSSIFAYIKSEEDINILFVFRL